MEINNLNSLEEAVNYLNSRFKNGELDKFIHEKQKNIILYHSTLGRWIRNNLGLWENSKLFWYFFNLGIEHPDDMSYEIMMALWKLNVEKK